MITNLVKYISDKNYNLAEEAFDEAIQFIMEKKLEQKRKMLAAKDSCDCGCGGYKTCMVSGDPKDDFVHSPSVEKLKRGLTEEELDEARIKIIKARIRAGKVQRRKKVSNVPGYTLRGGQLKKMTPMERRRRRLGQRRGKIKRRAKLSRSLVKRQRSLRKRTSLGLPQ